LITGCICLKADPRYLAESSTLRISTNVGEASFATARRLLFLSGLLLWREQIPYSRATALADKKEGRMFYFICSRGQRPALLNRTFAIDAVDDGDGDVTTCNIAEK
jgi:hypothetical protein